MVYLFTETVLFSLNIFCYLSYGFSYHLGDRLKVPAKVPFLNLMHLELVVGISLFLESCQSNTFRLGQLLENMFMRIRDNFNLTYFFFMRMLSVNIPFRGQLKAPLCYQ